MKLRGQQSGYAMAVLLISMTVMAIMMTVAMPTWKQMAQREKETELVFRGEQYARAMSLFQTKAGPGVLPPSIDLLVEQRFLRKKFKDPVTNEDFVPILQVPGAGGAGAPGATAAAGQSGGAAQGRGGAGAAPGTAPGTPPGTTPGAAASGGIMGVTSKSKAVSIRIYKGRSHYNEWQFMPVARVLAAGAPSAPGAPGAGGQRGPQGNQPPGFPGGTGGGRQGIDLTRHRPLSRKKRDELT